MSIRIYDNKLLSKIHSNTPSIPITEDINSNINEIFNTRLSESNSPDTSSKTPDELYQRWAELTEQTCAELEKELTNTPKELDELLKGGQGISEPVPNDQSLGKKLQELAEVKAISARLEAENQISDFYAAVLDSYRNLHSDLITGSSGTNHLAEISHDISSFLEQFGHTLTTQEKKQLQTCADQAKKASEYENRVTDFWVYPWEEEIKTLKKKEIVHQIHKDMTSLADGQSLILRGSVENHAILYKIKRENGTYVFTIINTGIDEEPVDLMHYINRNYSIDSAERTFDIHKNYRYSDKAYQCPLSALDQQFFTTILPWTPCQFSMQELIEQVDTMMKSAGANAVQGRAHHQQGRGTCYYKSVTSWLHGELEASLYARLQVFRTEHKIEKLRQFESEPGRRQFLADEVYRVNPKNLQTMLDERDEAAEAVYQKRLGKALAAQLTLDSRAQVVN